MRKVLLATTALVGVALAGAAHAAPNQSPISLTVGGYVDVIGAEYSEAPGTAPATVGLRTTSGMETEYKLNFDALGKASNGIEYGANISLWNGPEVTNLWRGGTNTVELNSAYVWLSSAFGKVMVGDEHGASDLFIYAPTVGEGQVDGRYMDFTDPTTLARFYGSGIDNTEHGTKITYYTPKIGVDGSKIQAGLSFEPNAYNYGSGVPKYSSTVTGTGSIAPNSPYKNVVDGAVEYWGKIAPVSIAASANVSSGIAGSTASQVPGIFGSAPATGQGFQDYTTWGLGAQLGFNGFTVGASYTDLGKYGATHGQNKSQNVTTLGAKYEFDKLGVAVNYLNGTGYNNLLVGGNPAGTSLNNSNYVSSFNAYGAGGTYTWFPGMTTNADAVFFAQTVQAQADHDDGYVLLLSQKLAF